MESILNMTVRGYTLSIIRGKFGDFETHNVRVYQSEESSVEIRDNATLGVSNLDDIEFKISVPSKNMEVSGLDRHIKELEDAKHAISKFTESIRTQK